MTAVAQAERLAFSPDEAARVLGVSRATIMRIVADGSLRSAKIGRRRVIARSALLELLGEGGAL